MNPMAIVDVKVRVCQDHYLSSGFMVSTKHPLHCLKHRKLNCQKFSEECLLKYIAINLGYDCLTCTNLESLTIIIKMTAILLFLEGE